MNKYIYPYRVSVVRERTDRYEKVDSSRPIYEIGRTLLDDAATERVLTFMLDTKNRILGFVETSVGSLNFSVVHPRDTFRAAVIQGAASIILLHNHPSGDPTPGIEDHNVTKLMFDAGKILGIRVLDHIIIGIDGYYSFADNGLIGNFG